MNSTNQKIPEGWSVKRLGECVEGTQLGGNYENSESNKGLPLIKMGNLSRGKIVLDKIEYIPENTIHNEKDILHYGDLLFNTRNTLELVGKVSIWKNELPTALFNSNILRFTFNPNIIKNSFFMNYYFNSEKGLKLLRARAIGTTSVAAIYWRDCINMKILLPPLPEQEKIAGILGTWDEAIEKLSSLIKQKKNLKKGLMQRLLTGKTRLKGFTQPWKEVKLGEIFNIKKGQGLSTDVLDSKGVYKCILYGELYTKYSEVIKNTISRTNKNEKITSNIGDILIPASTTTSGIDLANATALLESDVILGGDINILRAKKEISPVFFAYLLTHSYKFDIARLAQGITIVHLYAEFLKSMKVFVPTDITEQKAIADVLSTADDEIDLLNKKLEALKEQKKGLMQQLLTGQIRVKVN